MTSVILLSRSICVSMVPDGPLISSTETISMFMYNGAFVYFRMGYIAAAGLLVLIVVISICLALSKPLKRHHG